MNPFVQAKDVGAQGTGLGLAICKQLAESMGGQLSFDSELGKGSIFTIELYGVKTVEAIPRAESGVAAEAETSREQTPGDDKPVAEEMRGARNMKEDTRIMIVDDVPLNLAVLKALLAKNGIRNVETAVDGQDAWNKLLASEKPFDLILTDMWMPKMDGKALVAKIRAEERFAGLPVYAVTADIEEKKTFAEHGFNGVLLKPLTIEKLSNMFNKNGTPV